MSIWDFPQRALSLVGLNRDQPTLFKEEAIAKIATNSSSHNFVDQKIWPEMTETVDMWCIVHDGSVLMLLVTF